MCAVFYCTTNQLNRLQKSIKMTGEFSADIKIEEHLPYLEFIFLCNHFQREIGIMLIDLYSPQQKGIGSVPVKKHSTRSNTAPFCPVHLVDKPWMKVLLADLL